MGTEEPPGYKPRLRLRGARAESAIDLERVKSAREACPAAWIESTFEAATTLA
jgi:hypothetical protein